MGLTLRITCGAGEIPHWRDPASSEKCKRIIEVNWSKILSHLIGIKHIHTDKAGMNVGKKLFTDFYKRK